MTRPSFPLTIYYDASCPLCAAELHAIRDYDEQKRLDLIDCSSPDFRSDETEAAGITIAELMETIHARDAAGRWYRGVDVFVLAYTSVGIEGIAGLWAHPGLRPLWDRLYPWIARHRMALSRLHLHGAFGWLVRRAAQRADRQRTECGRTCGRAAGRISLAPCRCRSARRSPTPDGKRESNYRRTFRAR